MPKPCNIITHCDTEESAAWLLKILKFRRHSNGVYYRKRDNPNIGQPDFEHDKAEITGSDINFQYTYKESNHTP